MYRLDRRVPVGIVYMEVCNSLVEGGLLLTVGGECGREGISDGPACDDVPGFVE